ncbi:GntR family transcriptional regulator [Brevundimonas diminuta]|uniref:HTH gntR-type domain-containing protein n=1 Tax=Brevundimonas diminuta TaxID=293 RepID=A0A1Z3LW79_BREDI|nr:GntR family transcriptional regulator [Brevundimonas diminuta]ASD26247.1 hypothetical protein CD943_04680 [Brevundimonas diminuta]
MARNRDPFTQALSSLRERIQSGELTAGAAVIVMDEAARLGLSTTPVREALARLSGEGLVERAPSGGYVTVRLDATAARDRYAMNAHFIRIALEANASSLGGLRPPAPRENAPPDLAAHRLFSCVVRSAGNQVLWDAFERVSGLLVVLRQAERVLFGDLTEETQGLYDTYAETAAPDFLEGVERYHQRRAGAAGALAALALAGAEEQTA